MVMPSLSSILVKCGLLASFAHVQVVGASEFSGPTEVKKHLAENDYTLLACDAIVALMQPQIETSTKLLKEWKTIQEDVASAAAIDCLAAPKFCQEMDVVSFPAIRLYQKDGPTTRYRGPRRAAPIQAFVKRALRPSVQDVDGRQLAGFIGSDDYVFVARLQDENQHLDARFRSFAHEYYDRYSFGITSSNDPSGIWCYNNLDESQHTAADLDRADSLKDLLDLCTAELIPQLTRRNEAAHLSSGRSLVFYLSNSEVDRETCTKTLKRVAQRYAEFLKFVTVNSGEYPDMARNLGVRSSGGLAVQNVHNGQIFPFRGDAASSDEVDQFIVAISEGRAQPWDGTFDEETEDKGNHDEL
ncbi:hypothetical protein V8C37DRAFT_369195 [Trichoderma ceciliae]